MFLVLFSKTQPVFFKLRQKVCHFDKKLIEKEAALLLFTLNFYNGKFRLRLETTKGSLKFEKKTLVSS